MKFTVLSGDRKIDRLFYIGICLIGFSVSFLTLKIYLENLFGSMRLFRYIMGFIHNILFFTSAIYTGYFCAKCLFTKKQQPM